MIHKFQITNFKRLGTKEIILKDNISLVVGGNNSGKTSVLHALAVWEYAKQVLVYEKSPRALYHGLQGSLICFNEENGSQSASVFSCATGLGAWRKRDDER